MDQNEARRKDYSPPLLKDGVLDEESNTLYLWERVELPICKQLAAAIDHLNRKKALNFFTLSINSMGGATDGMWALIHRLLDSRTEVRTVNECYAASAAFDIFLAGKKRFAREGTMFMCHHELWSDGGFWEEYGHRIAERHWQDSVHARLVRYLSERLKMPKEMVEMKLLVPGKPAWLTEDEAKELNIVHEILHGGGT